MAEVNDSLEGPLGSRMSGDHETVSLTATMQMSGCECKQRPRRGQPGQTDTVVRDLNVGAGGTVGGIELRVREGARALLHQRLG